MTDTTATANESDTATAGPRYDDVNTPVILMIGVISAIVTVLIIALVQGMAYQWEQSYLKKREQLRTPSVVQIENQKKMLDGKIEGAIDKVVGEFGS